MLNIKKILPIVVGFILIGMLLNFAGVLSFTGTGAQPIVFQAGDSKLGDVEFLSTTLASATYPANEAITFDIDTRFTAYCSSNAYTKTVTISRVILYWPSEAGPMQITATGPQTSITQTGYGTTSEWVTHTVTLQSQYATGSIAAEIWYEFEASVYYNNELATSGTTAMNKVAVGTLTFGGGTGTVGHLAAFTSFDGVSVSITGPYTSTMTSINGMCQWTNIPTGTYSITMARDGYESQYLSATVTENKETTIDHGPWVEVQTGGGTGDIGGGTTTGYVWTTTALVLAAGGILGAALAFAFLPMPPNVRALLAMIIAIAALVAAHLKNIGAW